MAEIKVSGIPVETISKPIREALGHYSSMTNGTVQFDADAAAELIQSPDSESASSRPTDVDYRGEAIGRLTVIALAPQDGTGTPLENPQAEPFLIAGKPSPKWKPTLQTCHTAAHLTIATYALPREGKEDSAALYQGSIQQRLLNDGRLRFHTLGQKLGADKRPATQEPLVSLYTGYTEHDARFGDQTALTNRLELIQVFGILSTQEPSQMFEALAATR
jgi:hypothetical protein